MEVKVYGEKETPVEGAEVLSMLTATDVGEGMLIEVIGQMVDSAKHVGGQALWIREIDSLKDNRVYSLVLRERDLDPHRSRYSPNSMDTLMRKSIDGTIEYNKYIPLVDVSYYAGFGFITGRAPGMSRFGSLEDDLSQGKTRTVKFRNHPKGVVGWGVLYSEYASDASYFSESANYKSNVVEPFCSFMLPIANNKLLLNAEIGIGYHRSNWKLSNSRIIDFPVKATTYAPQLALGLDYIILPYVIISANVTGIIVRNTAVTYDVRSMDLPVGFGKNMDCYQVSLGIRFFLYR
jgi:hypothetical protein